MSDVTWNPAGDDDTSFGPLTAHNVLGGRTAADAHPAAAVSYDNDVSGLTGDTVQEAIDELATTGGGAVSSVNGETGVVVLDAADVGAVPTARTITAGTGLTGGGDLSADRTLTVTYGATAGTAAEGNDARLTDARTPLAHAASHQDGGSDELALDGSQITTGTVGTARLGSGTASSGTYLRGDQTWQAVPSGGIPETLIDAAGDLIVGTAADTAGRLAIGTAGQVLTSNGTTAAWAPPPMASISYGSGAVYGLGGNAGSVNYHSASAAGRWVAHPVWLPAGSYAGLSVLSTVAAVATWRLGIYSGTPDGATTLLHDCGTIDMNASPGSLLASSAFTITTTGLYWLALLVDAHTAVPTVWSFRGSVSDIPALPYLGHRFISAIFTRVSFARLASGVTTGAMPATAPTQTLTDMPCLIRAHAA